MNFCASFVLAAPFVCVHENIRLQFRCIHSHPQLRCTKPILDRRMASASIHFMNEEGGRIKFHSFEHCMLELGKHSHLTANQPFTSLLWLYFFVVAWRFSRRKYESVNIFRTQRVMRAQSTTTTTTSENHAQTL